MTKKPIFTSRHGGVSKQQKFIIMSASITATVCVILIIVFFRQIRQSAMGLFTKNYFTDKELYASTTATRNHIDNTPNESAWQNLYALRDNILNPAREQYGSCIYINCAYRCQQLNTLVGGTSNSQHLSGQAADITTSSEEGNRELFRILVSLGNFDQLIWEGNGKWIHVSYDASPRRMILAQTTNGYKNITSNWQNAIA